MYRKDNLHVLLDKYSYKNIDFDNANVVLRTCLNVPIKNGQVTDMNRIDESVVLINDIKEKAKRVVILAHLGRPEKREEEFSFKQIIPILEEKIGEKIVFFENIDQIDFNRDMLPSNKDKCIALVDNIRFFAQENSKDEFEKDEFAKQLASLGNVYINDAFADYRESPSTYNIAKYLKSYLGPVFLKEVYNLSKVENAESPFVCLLGGAKLSEKIDVINSLGNIADKILVGGALAYSLMKAKGIEVGDSLVEEDKLDVAKEILAKYGEKIVLPIDHYAISEFKEEKTLNEYQYIESQNIPSALIGVDIGDKSISLYQKELKEAKTILWNGPVGVYEWNKCKRGTSNLILEIFSNKEAFKIIGGGDSLSNINSELKPENIHLSTGGGAMLAFLSYDTFPTLDIILNQSE